MKCCRLNAIRRRYYSHPLVRRFSRSALSQKTCSVGGSAAADRPPTTNRCYSISSRASQLMRLFVCTPATQVILLPRRCLSNCQRYANRRRKGRARVGPLAGRPRRLQLSPRRQTELVNRRWGKTMFSQALTLVPEASFSTTGYRPTLP